MSEVTMTQLETLNALYLVDHTLNESILDKVNSLIELIEARTQQEPRPSDGDMVVIIHPDKGVLYNHAHLEMYDHTNLKGGTVGRMYENGATVCTNPYTPFMGIREDGTLRASSTSGGYWSGLDLNKLVYKGTQEKEFVVWGRSPQANGAVTFKALVNVWELTDSKFY